jgi:hypothetical protein
LRKGDTYRQRVCPSVLSPKLQNSFTYNLVLKVQ